MEETINKLVIEHLGLSFFIAAVVVVGIVAVSIWCYKVYAKVNKIDTLPCETHKDKMAEHDSAVSNINTSITFLSKEIDTAMRMLQSITRTDAFTQSHSPLAITQKGWEMVRRLGVDKMFEKNWQRIKSLIDSGVGNKNAYDIDDFCIKQAVVFPEKFLGNDEILILKDDAFKKGLTLTSYMKVIAVMSRDRYFEENGLKKEDIESKPQE